MEGTMPLNNQVPASDPISKSIRIADMADPMLFTIPFSKSSQVLPCKNATMPATAADKISTIWLEPANESSPKIKTLIEINAVKKITGIKAANSVGLFLAIFIISIVKFRLLKYNYFLIC